MRTCLRTRLLLVGLLIWGLLFFFFSPNNNPYVNHDFPTVFLSSVHYSSSNPTNSGQVEEDKGIEKTIKPSELPTEKNLNDSDDWEEYFSNGKKVVSGLWMGNVTSNMLSLRLQKAKRGYTSLNSYNVTFKSQPKKQQGKQQLLCQLKQQAQVRTLEGDEEPFASLGWSQLVPSQPLEKLNGTPYRTCAVVSSAGAILNSSLGKEIDSHHAVLRFNSAPTENYENDVGSKTTIRILNSQVIADLNKGLANSTLYKNITLVGWDPGPYSADLQKWYKSPDFDFFSAYMDYRRRFPNQPFYILHPTFLWGLWDLLQANTAEKIQTNPPSSGFIGIVLMMTLCEQVDIYEFIPSERHTTLCHYYSEYRDMACTLGAYHPLLYEKLLVKRISSSTFSELLAKGKVTVPGFSQITCPS